MDWAERFHHNFLAQLKRENATAEQVARWALRPYRIADLRIVGEGRDRDLARLTLDEAQAAAALDAVAADDSITPDFYRSQKVVLVLVPGFTHETLRNLSWHEQIERRDSPHHVVMLRPGWQNEPPQEIEYARGDGFKLLYVRYPRSNAAARHILGPLFEMLHRSTALRGWVEQGYKLFFVGYSYGSPLSLELLAALHAGHYADEFILRSTLGFLGLCGDIGGSYLADDVLKPDAQLLNIHRVVDFCRRHRWIGTLAGLGTQQLLDDMVGGVESLGHAERQAALRRYAPDLPPQLKYFTVSAVLPLADYRRRWWQFNLDDYAMYRQARVSDPVSVYNDGQVTLDDHLLPATVPIPPQNNIHLGAVRAHHWGVSYRTFNFGRNRFPRPAFYRALMRTIAEAFARSP
ncbi:hypothetical protein AAG565_13200 [Fontimonas sp. SYSU GA230001]|uniref:hypothetical protein n=1 Tax=Fontimonas sp. SYSU GA230001 TaxID=3142450 RepID=UPI0032B566CC